MTRGERTPFRYRVDFGGGERDVFSFLDAEWVARHGLPPQAVVAVVRPGAGDPAPADVQENGLFLRLLSRLIYETADRDDELRRDAATQGDGHLFLLDRRTPQPDGPVPTEDILGTVEVSGGAVVRGSYRHHPQHRLFTATGWFRLPDHMEAELASRLHALVTPGSPAARPREARRRWPWRSVR